MILAPLVRGRRGAHRDVLESIQKAGFVRARIDGVTYPLDEIPPLAPQKMHDIEAVVDRARDSRRNRRAAGRIGAAGGTARRRRRGRRVSNAGGEDRPVATDQWQERLLNTRYACPRCQTSIGEIEPRTFSFNSPYGACPTCHGLGTIDGESGETASGARQERYLPVATSRPLPLNADSQSLPCPDCGGSRLRPEARACRLGGLAIHEITALSVTKAIEFFRGLTFTDDQRPVAEPIVAEIVRRLAFLDRVGTEYLTLDRPADTLSGGERQRVRLATGIGSGLVGVLYLLDEPSIGLHPRDNDRLIAALRDLQQQGNTVVVVEHDEALMRASDHLIDIGPGRRQPRRHASSPKARRLQVAKQSSHRSPAAYLSGRESIPLPAATPPADQIAHCCNSSGATAHNLQDVDVEIPLGLFVCVTGVSGSGKSSLVVDTLARALARKLHGAEARPAPHRSLRGVNQLDRLVEVDQSPIGRTPRSNPATYTGVWDDIRRVFAGTKQARQRGYGIGRFSFNTKGGRCEECEGQGVRRIAMNFLPDLEVTCPVCHGARFNRQTLAVRYRERSIADVLAMSIDEAVEFFENHESIHRLLATLVRRRARLSDARPTVDDALRRRGAADQAGDRAGPASGRPHALHSRRADDRPAQRRHSPAAGRAQSARRSGQFGAGDRAQSGRDQDGRLGDRPRPGRRRRRRPGRS